MAPIQCPKCWIEVGEGNGLEIHLNRTHNAREESLNRRKEFVLGSSNF
jgi:hypothetical protein